MEVEIRFCMNSDIIDCPEEIIPDLMVYQKDFFNWLYDERINHRYWVSNNGIKYVCYRSEAFSEWLNEFVLMNSEKKAEVIKSHVPIVIRECPVLHF